MGNICVIIPTIEGNCIDKIHVPMIFAFYSHIAFIISLGHGVVVFLVGW